jgi:hypothetical protein
MAMLKTAQGEVIGSAPPLSDSETFFTRSEAAAYLRSSVPTLARWAQTGAGPKFRLVGGRALYALRDLREFAKVEAA